MGIASSATSACGPSASGDAHGRTRLLLSGEPYLHADLLDQGYGHWSGRVLDDSGEWVRVADVTGWAEDVHNRW